MSDAPTSRQRTLHACRTLIDSGQYAHAIPLLRGALKEDPRNPDLLRMLGHTLILHDQCAEGVRHLELASKVSPNDPDIRCDLAFGLARLEKLGAAHRTLDSVLEKDPAHGRCVSLKARLLQSRAQSDKAMQVVRRALESSRHPAIVVTYGVLARELKEYAPAIDLIRELLERPDLQRANRCDLLFTLGHLLDAQGDYDDAFAAFHSANRMSSPGEPQDLDVIARACTRAALDRVPRSRLDASRAVLIVGMPRSGTTLTEQIIGAHPSAAGVGESPALGEIVQGQKLESMDQRKVDEGARRYLSMLDAAHPRASVRRVADKMPGNAAYLGVVERMLPGASVIHCVRDPRDTCLSIYFQNFGPTVRYANDLRACAEQHVRHDRLMAHWRETLGITILDSVYESLTRDPEPRVSALLDHIGLEFHRSCMEHHKSKSSVQTASIGQVRRPVYTTSTARWKRYEKHLGPMLEVLGDLPDP